MLVAAAADAAWFSASTLVMPLLVAVPTFNVAFALVGLVTHLSAFRTIAFYGLLLYKAWCLRFLVDLRLHCLLGFEKPFQ
jgi:hypothetical protein